MKNRKNSFLVWLLAAVLAVGMLPVSALPSFAGDEVNVSTGAELKAALESEGDKTVNLTADVPFGFNKSIDVKGNKALKLNGHKIMLSNPCWFSVPTGADLKVDGKADGSEIKSTGARIFEMKGGLLTIDEGKYINSLFYVMFIHPDAAGGKVEINDGYFQSIRGRVIYSRSEKSAKPPEIVINGGTFISDEKSVWMSPDSDVTKGTVNGGSFHGGGGAFDLGDEDNKLLGAGKYLVMDGEHNENTNLWHLKGTFIQVGNAANDFVNVTMNAADGGRGYFFRVAYNKTTVLAMKNNILPVVAVPEVREILSAWEKVSGDGDFVDKKLMNAYYIPKADSTLKPNFAAAPESPTLGIVGTYTYNGTEQTANVTGYDPATMRIEGNKWVYAGTRKISVYPKGPQWADGTSDPATVEWTINMANCTGAPTCTKITEAGKTLADATLNIGTISPAGGVLKWDDPLDTVVTQGTAYNWTYDPTNGSYEELKGSLIPWPASGGGGGGSGGGGGGGSSVPTYPVTVEKTENGTVTSSHASAAEGTTVVLTVTPDKGYVLDKLTVLDSKDNEIGAAKNEGKYSFKMPGSKVSVKAAFKKGEEKPDGDAADNKAKFTDVKDSDYFAKAVAWAVEKGITTGTTPTTFSPHAPCTRAQIVTFLWRAAGKPEPQKTDNPFADVKADAYYNKALLWAVEQNIVNGTSATSFSPDATCTRGQMAAILYRYAKSPDVKGDKSFADVKAGAYYANAVKWAAEQGITEGTGATSFSPDATCTRAQIVTFLYRYMGSK